MAILTLRNVGNSVGLGIPKLMLEQLALTAGSAVDVSVVDNAIVIAPTKKQYDIEEMAKDMRKNKQPDEIKF